MGRGKDIGAGLIDPRYCCLAVPLVNFGIYALLAEQAVLGVCIGVLAVATPDVVGAVFPNFATIIFAITCWAVTLCQPVGFVGVLREKTSTFRVYSNANAIALAAAFSSSAALIIVSALRHTEAVTACQSDFFSTANTNSTSAANMLTDEGEKLCPPFAWADVGIMGGLWLILLIVQGYFLYLTRSYSTSQVSDHKLYHSVYSENPEAFTMSVLRSSRYNPGSMYNVPPVGPNADAWDARPSMESLREEGKQTVYGREYSDVPNSYGYAEPSGRYEDAFAEGSRAFPNEADGYDAPQGHYPFSTPGGGYVDHPPEAYSRDPGQTPEVSPYQTGQGWSAGGGSGSSGLRMPEAAQRHPAEGMFGRKSPRIAEY